MTLSEFILAWRALDPVVKGRCFYCGVQTRRSGLKPSCDAFMTKDHVIPSCAAGCPRRANFVICCRKCNSEKSNYTLQEFKSRSGMGTFYAEQVLGARIEELCDIAEVSLRIVNTRRPSQGSIKLHGRPGPQPATDSRQG